MLSYEKRDRFKHIKCTWAPLYHIDAAPISCTADNRGSVNLIKITKKGQFYFL